MCVCMHVYMCVCVCVCMHVCKRSIYETDTADTTVQQDAAGDDQKVAQCVIHVHIQDGCKGCARVCVHVCMRAYYVLCVCTHGRQVITSVLMPGFEHTCSMRRSMVMYV